MVGNVVASRPNTANNRPGTGKSARAGGGEGRFEVRIERSMTEEFLEVDAPSYASGSGCGSGSGSGGSSIKEKKEQRAFEEEIELGELK